MYLLTFDWSLSMRHNVLIIWKKHTHSLSARFYQSQQWPLHSASVQEAAPGSAAFMNETCFRSGGRLQSQWLCNFVRSEACPVSFIISSLTEVTARPWAEGEALPWCTCRRLTWTSASSRAPARWSLSFTARLADLCIWTLLRRLIF